MRAFHEHDLSCLLALDVFAGGKPAMRVKSLGILEMVADHEATSLGRVPVNLDAIRDAGLETAVDQ